MSHMKNVRPNSIHITIEYHIKICTSPILHPICEKKHMVFHCCWKNLHFLLRKKCIFYVPYKVSSSRANWHTITYLHILVPKNFLLLWSNDKLIMVFKSWASLKGPLISKGLFGVLNSSKKQTKTSRPEVS